MFNAGDFVTFRNGERVQIVKVRTNRVITHALSGKRLGIPVKLPDDYVVRFDDGQTTLADQDEVSESPVKA